MNKSDEKIFHVKKALTVLSKGRKKGYHPGFLREDGRSERSEFIIFSNFLAILSGLSESKDLARLDKS